MLREGLLALLAVAGLSTMAQAQPKTVTLACEGTRKLVSSQQQTPISASIIIDLTSQTGEFDGHPIRFSSVTDTHVSFNGDNSDAPAYRASGTIDRVTGAVVAFVESHERQEMYSLKCKPPAQRMF
jgi:hypothetical protein